MTLLLVDADSLVYSTLAGTEEETCWDEDQEIWTLSTNLKQAKDIFRDRIHAIRMEHKPTVLVLCLSDEKNFRLDILPTYKWNRRDKRRPMGFKIFKEWVHTLPEELPHLKVIQFPKLEADDVVGILATKPGNEDDHLILSGDKDMNTIPGHHWRKGKVVHVSEDEADYYHLFQTLTGDQVDGYNGCPGIGPSTAEQILKKPMALEEYTHVIERGPRKGQKEKRWREKGPCSPWKAVVDQYRKAGLTEQDALVQARVARICRWEDWDYDNKKVIPWTPRKS